MSHTEGELPRFDLSVKCTKPDCVWKKAEPSPGYGMFGGGLGPYTICENCGTVLTKSQENPNDEAKDEPADNKA